MCIHESVTLCPTVTTLLGLDNRYTLACSCCKKDILLEGTIKEISNVLSSNQHKLSQGNYLISKINELYI
jgi:hypothetical protein